MDQNNREFHNSYCSTYIIHDGYQINQHHMHIACDMKGTLKHTKILMGNSEEKMLLWLPQGNMKVIKWTVIMCGVRVWTADSCLMV